MSTSTQLVAYNLKNLASKQHAKQTNSQNSPHAQNAVLDVLKGLLDSALSKTKKSSRFATLTRDEYQQYLDALSKAFESSSSTSTDKKQPHVKFFYVNDDKPYKKWKKSTCGEKKSSDQTSAKSDQSVCDSSREEKKTVQVGSLVVSEKKEGGDQKRSKKTSASPSSSKKFFRRRAFAYVWLELTPGNGVVFFGGSVFNPCVTAEMLLEYCKGKNVESVDDLTRVYADLVKTNSSAQYNRAGERSTALKRLNTCPVVFKTTATCPEQVRDEVVRCSFEHGVAAKRVKSVGGSKHDATRRVEAK